jgi:hypothetical protein
MRYNVRIPGARHMRILLSAVLLAAVLSGAGCTKCGWIWDDNSPKSCRNG